MKSCFLIHFSPGVAKCIFGRFLRGAAGCRNDKLILTKPEPQPLFDLHIACGTGLVDHNCSGCAVPRVWVTLSVHCVLCTWFCEHSLFLVCCAPGFVNPNCSGCAVHLVLLTLCFRNSKKHYKTNAFSMNILYLFKNIAFLRFLYFTSLLLNPCIFF